MVHLVLPAEAVVHVFYFVIGIMLGIQFLYWSQGGTASRAEGLYGILLCRLVPGYVSILLLLVQ